MRGKNKAKKSTAELQKAFLRGRTPVFMMNKKGMIVVVGPNMKMSDFDTNVIPLPLPYGWSKKV